ncbi:hypothetical protein AURDEDRAFT_177248 [Auricularia subglabra TFB-10046 SS5]|uniref:Uncharacterized protein n=1 Tax=Auricularia subglabra (strain TFB-10046 / SS5) TaxID=717982 RepID=J0CTM1_AURST|nr:hypothetical protein AURDEDRAFT_177248 [Auricularia subglabra TFB-10046 SS5]
MHLPPEVWAEIAGSISSKRDLAALVRVDKSISGGCTLLLYRDVVLGTPRAHGAFLRALHSRPVLFFTATVRSFAVLHEEVNALPENLAGELGCCFHRDVVKLGAVETLALALRNATRVHAHPVLLYHLLSVCGDFKPSEISFAGGHEHFFEAPPPRARRDAWYQPRIQTMIHRCAVFGGFSVQTHHAPPAGETGAISTTLTVVLDRLVAGPGPYNYFNFMDTPQASGSQKIIFVFPGATKYQLQSNTLFFLIPQTREQTRCSVAVAPATLACPETGWDWLREQLTIEELPWPTP